MPVEQKPHNPPRPSIRDSLVFLDTPNCEGFPIGTTVSMPELLHWSHGPTAMLLDTVMRTGQYTFRGQLLVPRFLCDPGESEARYIDAEHVLAQDESCVRARFKIDANHTRDHFLPTAGLGEERNPLAAYRIVRAEQETAQRLLPRGKTLLLKRASGIKYAASLPQGKIVETVFEKDEPASSDSTLVGSGRCIVDGEDATVFERLEFDIVDIDDPRIIRPHLSPNKFIEMVGFTPGSRNITGTNREKHGVPFYTEVSELVVFDEVYEGDLVVVETQMTMREPASYYYILEGTLATEKGIVGKISGHKTVFTTMEYAKQSLAV